MENSFERLLKSLGVEILQTKYEKVQLSVPDGTPAGTNASTDVTLDTAYHFCDGISIHEITTGGLSTYDVAIRNNNGLVLTPIPIQAVASGKADGSNPNARFLDLVFDSNSGNKVKLELTRASATSGSALLVVAVFRLRQLSKKVTLPQNLG